MHELASGESRHLPLTPYMPENICIEPQWCNELRAWVRVVPCDKCHLPAVSKCRDVKQVEGTGVATGWMEFEPAGDWHYLCDEHRRQPRTTYLDGRVE